MPAAIVARTDHAITIQVEIPFASSIIDFEEVIQQRLNERGSWPPPRPSSRAPRSPSATPS